MMQNEPNPALIGTCGLFCGACENYLAFREGHGHLLSKEKFDAQRRDAEYCEGCHSKKLSAHCAVCAMRLCAESRKILHCGECELFPCETISEFRKGGDVWDGARHRKDIFANIERLRAEGTEKWLAARAGEWRCACGKPFSFYETRCQDCGKELPSYAKR
jgi:hypothetical protein